MDYEDKIDNLSRKIRGEILAEAIMVESCLTRVLDNYFFKENSEKARIFFWEILNTRSFLFEDKIRVFKKVPSFKRWKKYKEIISSLTFVQNLRNKIAHWDVNFQKSTLRKIVIYDPIKLNKKIIDSKVLEQFDQAVFDIHHDMCKNHNFEPPQLKHIFMKSK